MPEQPSRDTGRRLARVRHPPRLIACRNSELRRAKTVPSALRTAERLTDGPLLFRTPAAQYLSRTLPPLQPLAAVRSDPSSRVESVSAYRLGQLASGPPA